MATEKTIKSAFESMMFVWGEPLDPKIAAEAFGIDKSEAKKYFDELKKEYEETQRGIQIREIAGKYQFVTAEENYDYIRAVCTPIRNRRLSQAALEVLAIIAYKQPVTKSEIDSIRGIKSDRVLDGLLQKELIEVKGRSEAIGRPLLYGTTEVFLGHFDLETIKQLPLINDLEDSFGAEPPRSVDEMRQTTFAL